MTDLLIILSFASEQDKNTFDYLYTNYKKLLLYKAYEILKDYMLAEDAVSEAYLRIYKNLHKIEDPASPKAVAFLVTITKNAALTILSKERKNTTEEYDETIQDSFDLEKHILSEISSEQIYGLLDRLPEDLKSVFLMKFAYDLPHKEIGKVLHISENNVTVRLHRAKKKLSELLIKEGYASEQSGTK